MNVLVETSDGTACICGDVVYNIQQQIVRPTFQLQYREPKTTGNFDVSVAQERGAVKKALSSGAWLLPMHDQPAKLDRAGRVIGRLEGKSIPGPLSTVEHEDGKAWDQDLSRAQNMLW